MCQLHLERGIPSDYKDKNTLTRKRVENKDTLSKDIYIEKDKKHFSFR